MRAEILTCPVCGKALLKDGSRYICESSHCFDIASSGYVNLLPSSGGIHGDNKLMIRARRDFLNRGIYAPLAEKVAEVVAASGGGILLDAGCGECYYTERIISGCPVAAVGIDISKDALKYAGKRLAGNDITLAAASVYNMPVQSGSCDILLNMFAPFDPAEYLRVLKPGGSLIMVIPGKRHLMGLKAVLYDKPYENKLSPFDIDGFELTGHLNTAYDAFLPDTGAISDLFMMTPYFYRTESVGKERLLSLGQLTTPVEFEILCYKKPPKP